jgi:hypothetical protein
MGKHLLQDKRVVLFIYFMAVVSLVVLASGLNNVSPRRSQVEINSVEESHTAPSEEPLMEVIFPKQILYAIAVILTGALIALIFLPKERKALFAEALKRLAAYAFIFLTIYIILGAGAIINNLFPKLDFGSGAVTPPSQGNVGEFAFSPSQPSDTFLFVIMLIIALAISIAIWRVYVWVKVQNKTSNPLDEIANMARASLRELSLQTPPRDAIINCYENMSQAVTKRRGLDRKATMTAAEFAQKLRRAGLPDEPVDRLTRLFETARYSPHPSTQKDIDEAVLCLTSILKYCGEKA